MLDQTDKFCIVVTGLPASGKTTVGKNIAQALDIPYFDKEDFLESLYETQGIGDSSHRQYLSRHSDELFQEQAQKLDQVVLISHWRPVNYGINSGTRTEWITDTYAKIVELYCDCSVELATNRFKQRTRHPGHLDEQRSTGQIQKWMQMYQTLLPLNIGKLIQIDTTAQIDYRKLTQQIELGLSTS